MPHERERILCYVTDRRALAGAPSPRSPAISPQAAPHPAPSLRETIRRAATAGVDWIQIREKDLPAGRLLDLARLAVSDTLGTRARIIINDRLDVVLAAGAAGVHLGESSLPPEAVAGWRRAAGRESFRIGVSCHSTEAACAAERAGADYVFFGPVFATPSKAAFGPPQGLERLREVCHALRIPVLAIGGVMLENAAACVAAGAAGVAAIRLFQESADLAAVVARLRG